MLVRPKDLFNFGDFIIPSVIGTDVSTLQIPLEVYQREKEWFIKAFIPGIKKEDIHLDVEKGYISIIAVRPKPDEKYYLSEIEYGELKTKLKLSGLSYIEKENIKANFMNGVLEITIIKDVNSIPYSVEID